MSDPNFNIYDHVKRLFFNRDRPTQANPDLLDSELSQYWYIHVGRQAIVEAVNRWEVFPGDHEASTWLTYAVKDMNFEYVAILMSYGANPYSTGPSGCPGRSAYDCALIHFNDTVFRPEAHFMCTLLNTEGNTSLHNNEKFRRGANPNAPLPKIQGGVEIIDREYDTPLTLAAAELLPYCTRWLLKGRHANPNIANGQPYHMLPLETALLHCPNPHPFSLSNLNTNAELKSWSKMVLLLLEETDCDDKLWEESWSRMFNQAYRYMRNLIDENYRGTLVPGWSSY